MFEHLGVWWFQITASGLIDAVWHEIFRWGLGIGAIILCIIGAFVSPIGKQNFVIGAVCIFFLLVAYEHGQKDANAVCEARVKRLYLQTHPKLNSKNLAKHWKVSPSWDPSKPVRYKPLPRSNTCYMGWGC